VLGYGFVWSGPRRPAEFIEYEKHLAEYNKSKGELDWETVIASMPQKAGQAAKPSTPAKDNLGFVPNSPAAPQPPKEPEGYLAYPYKQSTAEVDYGRVLLEFGALTGLLLVSWILTYAEGKSK
jgi:hypothetical protein